MSPKVRNLTLMAGIAVVAAGGAAAFMSNRPAAQAAMQIPVAPPAPPPPTPAPAEPPPPPAFVPGFTSPDTQAAPAAPTQAAAAPALTPPPPATPATTTFAPQPQDYSLIRDSAAYVAATPDAPQMYPLRAGTAVAAVAKSSDARWVIALTEDGQAAFLPAADLGPYDPNLAPAPELPATVAGVTQVVDTATLTVDGQQVPLLGVKGEGGAYAAQLQSMINKQGDQVSCTLHGQAYVCVQPDGTDVARVGLYNGGAELADGASNDYRAQAEAARAAHRGIWR